MAIYPHKQTVIVFIVCAIVITAALYSMPARNNPDSTGIQATASGDIKADLTVDSGTSATIANNDDWKKQFFDGAAVSHATAANNSAAPVETPLTLTDKIGRDFFTQYVRIKQAGLDGDATAVSNVANDLSGSLSDSLKPAVYVMADIKAISDSSAAANAYAKDLALALKYMPAADAAEIANSAFDKGDMNLLKGIDPIIVSYQNLRTALVAMSAPQSVSQYHLNLVNGVSKVLFNAQALRKLEVDPAQSLAALSVYLTAFQSMSNSLNNIQSYFNLNGVRFSS